MTDRNGKFLDDEHHGDELLETINQIKTGLDKLDSIDTFTPGEPWFEQLVLHEQEKIKKKNQKELLWFMVSALLIISCVIVILLEVPLLFLTLQGAAVAVAGLYSFRWEHKQVDSR